ncbi:MAG: ABC transporter permease [Cyanobacteriota bacterium]|nr:ABC transporter permease [Cyanobacteriota bacterium]
MIVPTKATSHDNFLQRIGIQSNGNIWSALIVDPTEIEEVLEDLQETIEVFAECEVAVISCDRGTPNALKQIQNISANYFLLYNLEAWKIEDWQALDFSRSRLDKQTRGGVFVLSVESAKTMLNYAPNLVSWFGTRIYQFDKDADLMTQQEREIRLSALREWFGKSDLEIIAMAESSQLPPAPEYGEWLILLNRGDLIER